MLKNIYMLSLILSFAHAIGASNAEKTDLLRAEVAAHKNPHIAQETHPTLYALVQELSSKAGITMPEYITLYDILAQQISWVISISVLSFLRLCLMMKLGQL